ncbi:MAG: DUF3341 domain-containing protein [Bacteroidota bacterium]|nr:DUF3341 domain-containing protein [Bacteroidota bacterium]
MRKSVPEYRHTLHAVFADERDVKEAARALRAEGYTILDAYTPYAVHGLDRILGQRPSRLPWVCLAFGLTGAAAKLWFQIWTSASDWPVNVGGKPLASVPAFVPVTFEITVLFAGLGTVAAFLLRAGLRPGKRVKPVHPRVTDDRFVLVLLQDNAAFRLQDVEAICGKHRVVEVEERLEEVS